jgi:hypothetical protein
MGYGAGFPPDPGRRFRCADTRGKLNVYGHLLKMEKEHGVLSKPPLCSKSWLSQEAPFTLCEDSLRGLLQLRGDRVRGGLSARSILARFARLDRANLVRNSKTFMSVSLERMA